MDISVTKMFLTVNRNSRPGIALKKVNGVVIHYVGNPGSSARDNRNYFESLKDSKTIYASSHYIIGLDGEIIQCVPENEISYASNNRNNDTISIETCHPEADGKFNKKTYNGLIDLTADICKRYCLDPMVNVIRHFDVTGKKCPLYYVNNPDKWGKLKYDVHIKMNEPIQQPDNSKANGVKVRMNGKDIEISADNIDGRYYASLNEISKLFTNEKFIIRDILNTCGYEVSWIGRENTITAEKILKQ